MAEFTYDLSLTGNDLIVSQVRLQIGDEEENQGVKPNGTNYSDAEILQFYDDEGTVGRTAAGMAEALSLRWAGVPYTHIGGVVDPKVVSKNYAETAKRLREMHGYPTGTQQVTSFSIAMARPGGTDT